MKKIISLVLVLMLALSAIGGTLAYFTDKDQNTNTFVMGDLDIVLDEAKVTKTEGEDTWTAGEERVKENNYGQVYPGAVLPKDPTIHNVGDHDAYVWATVNVSNWANIYVELGGDAQSRDGLTKLIGDTLGEGWSIYSVIPGDTLDYSKGIMDVKYVLKYAKRLEAENEGTTDDTTAMFETLTIPSEFTNAAADWGFKTIDVKAFAIQAEGFKDWDAAYAAYNAQVK